MTKIAIHQSEYIPWPPYFKKAALADIFVVLDNVQFQKNGIQNRNRLRNQNGPFWMTIPVTGSLADHIKDKKISDQGFRKKHFNSLLFSYSKAPFWSVFAKDLAKLYDGSYFSLGEINQAFLGYIFGKLNIQTDVYYSSGWDFCGKKSDLILNICKHFKADTYISGAGGKNYLKENEFRKSGIEIKYIKSEPPVYQQFHKGVFVEGLSILDMFFNVDLEEIKKYSED
ncbi:MAG: WbqC family protein [Candidatus Omnitrophica bacterium]|nr:WbqC family protein [Candidatus Omnitrophota bacterium]